MRVAWVHRDASSESAERDDPSLGPWDDPGRLIEDYLGHRAFQHEDPSTIMLAWLMALGPGLDPLEAAQSLTVRLLKKRADVASAHQLEIFSLLCRLACHGRLGRTHESDFDPGKKQS